MMHGYPARTSLTGPPIMPFATSMQQYGSSNSDMTDTQTTFDVHYQPQQQQHHHHEGQPSSSYAQQRDEDDDLGLETHIYRHHGAQLHKRSRNNSNRNDQAQQQQAQHEHDLPLHVYKHHGDRLVPYHHQPQRHATAPGQRFPSFEGEDDYKRRVAKFALSAQSGSRMWHQQQHPQHHNEEAPLSSVPKKSWHPLLKAARFDTAVAEHILLQDARGALQAEMRRLKFVGDARTKVSTSLQPADPADGFSISVACRNLSNHPDNWLSKPDPCVLVLRYDATQTAWTELGRTEFHKNERDPRFAARIVIPWCAVSPSTILRFVVHSSDTGAIDARSRLAYADVVVAVLLSHGRAAASRGTDPYGAAPITRLLGFPPSDVLHRQLRNRNSAVLVSVQPVLCGGWDHWRSVEHSPVAAAAEHTNNSMSSPSAPYSSPVRAAADVQHFHEDIDSTVIVHIAARSLPKLVASPSRVRSQKRKTSIVVAAFQRRGAEPFHFLWKSSTVDWSANPVFNEELSVYHRPGTGQELKLNVYEVDIDAHGHPMGLNDDHRIGSVAIALDDAVRQGVAAPRRHRDNASKLVFRLRNKRQPGTDIALQDKQSCLVLRFAEED